jgi:hypothetical protein
MPRVDGKEFEYTKEGYAKAKHYAKKKGKKMRVNPGARKEAAGRMLKESHKCG